MKEGGWATFFSILLVVSLVALGVGPAGSAGAAPTEQEEEQFSGIQQEVSETGNTHHDDELSLTAESVVGSAGGAGSPSTISALVRIEEGGTPYEDSVSSSNFTITVGNETVEEDTMAISSEALPPGQTLVSFSPPEQDDAGNYDLEIEFDGDADDTIEGAVSYSATETGVIAANLQVDVSGSMRGIMDEARGGGVAFVEQASDDDYVSLVSYSSSATIEKDLVQLGDSRSEMIGEINALSAGGTTNIGDAFNDGLTTLDDAPEGTTKAAIHMTDGQLNRGPSESEIINDIIPEYNERGICVYTIGFTSAADEAFMQEVASAADCGYYEFAAESGEADEAEETLQAVFEDMQRDVAGESGLGDSSGSVAPTETETGSFDVDDSVQAVTMNVQFDGITLEETQSENDSEVLTVESSDVEAITLIRPDGSEIQADHPDVNISTFDETNIIRIDNPDAGEWGYELINTGEENAEYSTTISGFAQTDINVGTDAETYSVGGEASVLTTLTGQDGPVRDADVVASVSSPEENTTELSLDEVAPGVYVGTVDADEVGTYEADIRATKDDIVRERTTEWDVIDEQRVDIGTDSPAVEQGTNGTAELTVEAASEDDTVVFETPTLERVDGDGTIESDQIEFEDQSPSLSANEESTLNLTVDVPRDTEFGEYEGTLISYTESGERVETSTNITVDISRIPADYETDGTLDVDGLLKAVDEFRSEYIDVSTLLDVIDAFVGNE